jgi:phasin
LTLCASRELVSLEQGDGVVSENETKIGLNGGGSLGMPWFGFSRNVFGEVAERGVAQAQERCGKIKVLSEDFAETLSETYASNARGATDYGLKLIDISKANTASALEFVSRLLDLRSVTDVFNLSAAEARKAFDTAAAQNRELFDLAQRLARETGEPIRKHVANALQQTG